MILHFFYWGNNQYLVQRALAAKSLRHARYGVFAGMALKLLVPFFSIAGGIAAAQLFRARGLEGVAPDDAFSKLEKDQEKEKAHQVHADRSGQIHNMTQLLRAYTLYEKDVEYVVQDGRVQIVDEFTGRILSGRRYSDGLHQALEAKENVTVERETQTLATITIQNYFRLYTKLAGMTGTAETEANEFFDIYKLGVLVIPTNRPSVSYTHLTLPTILLV